MSTAAQARRRLPLVTIPPFVCNDNQAELLPRVISEKRKRELYAACERAPLGWEGRIA